MYAQYMLAQYRKVHNEKLRALFSTLTQPEDLVSCSQNAASGTYTEIPSFTPTQNCSKITLLCVLSLSSLGRRKASITSEIKTTQLGSFTGQLHIVL